MTAVFLVSRVSRQAQAGMNLFRFITGLARTLQRTPRRKPFFYSIRRWWK